MNVALWTAVPSFSCSWNWRQVPAPFRLEAEDGATAGAADRIHSVSPCRTSTTSTAQVSAK